MKDRIVQYPDRYDIVDTATGSVLQTVRLVPSPGIVTEEGTPLNKATLLSDNAARTVLLNPSSNPTVAEAIINAAKMGKWVLLESFTTAGSFSWKAPDYHGDGREYEIGVYIIGGGGSGAVNMGTSINRGATGGAAGYSKNFTATVTPGLTYNGVVGAGGAAVTGQPGWGPNGDNGGTTSFMGQTAQGGEGGKYGGNTTHGANGGQGSDAAHNSITNPRPSPYGCSNTLSISGSTFAYGGASQSPQDGQNAFDPLMVTLAAGGFAADNAAQPGATVTGGKGGDGIKGSGSITGNSATGYGNGGGAVYTTTTTGTVKSGAGSDGAVFIYVRGLA